MVSTETPNREEKEMILFECKDSDVLIEQVEAGEITIRYKGDSASITVGLEDLETALLMGNYGRKRKEILIEADSFLSAIAHNHIKISEETKEEALTISNKLRKYAENYYPRVKITNPTPMWQPE